MIPFTCGTQSSQNHKRQKAEWWLSGTGGKGEEFQFYKMTRVLGNDGGDGCITV